MGRGFRSQLQKEAEHISSQELMKIGLVDSKAVWYMCSNCYWVGKQIPSKTTDSVSPWNWIKVPSTGIVQIPPALQLLSWVRGSWCAGRASKHYFPSSVHRGIWRWQCYHDDHNPLQSPAFYSFWVYFTPFLCAALLPLEYHYVM